MQTFYFTDPGKVRSHNEDSVTILNNENKKENINTVGIIILLPFYLKQ